MKEEKNVLRICIDTVKMSLFHMSPEHKNRIYSVSGFIRDCTTLSQSFLNKNKACVVLAQHGLTYYFKNHQAVPIHETASTLLCHFMIDCHNNKDTKLVERFPPIA